MSATSTNGSSPTSPGSTAHQPRDTAHQPRDTGHQQRDVACQSRSRVLRSCLGRFPTGVTVVTFDGVDEDVPKRHGLTINSFTAVSMDPPLVLVSIQRCVRAHALLAGRPFTVNVLGAEQRDVALHFAGKPSVEPTWVEGEHAPRLAGTASWFECLPWVEYDGGDHTLFIGKVEHFDYRRGDCLGFVDGFFVTIPETRNGTENGF